MTVATLSVGGSRGGALTLSLNLTKGGGGRWGGDNLINRGIHDYDSLISKGEREGERRG